jgi:hypothetical protein
VDYAECGKLLLTCKDRAAADRFCPIFGCGNRVKKGYIKAEKSNSLGSDKNWWRWTWKSGGNPQKQAAAGTRMARALGG